MQPQLCRWMQVVAISAVCIIACTPSRAALVLTPATLDFGVVKHAKDQSTKEVTVTNAGSESATIRQVYAGCGCLSASLQGGPKLSPGESRKIAVTLNPAVARFGDYAYELAVTTDTGATATSRLTYNYHPDVELSADKMQIAANVDHPGSTLGVASGTIRFVDRWSQRLSIESITSSSPFIEVSTLDVIYTYRGTPTHTIDIIAVLPPGWPIGQVNESLNVITNHPEYRLLHIPIVGVVDGPVAIHPDRVLLAGISVGSHFHRQVILDADDVILVKELTTDSPDLTASLAPTTPSKRVVLSLAGSIQATDYLVASVGEYRHDVRLHITSPRDYWQTLEVVGVVEASASGSSTKP